MSNLNEEVIMGYGYWDNAAYADAAAARRAAGSEDFGYHASLRAVPRHLRTAAPSLNVYGVTTRDARDSADHPNSVPIVVLFDVTGSMGRVPIIVQRRLTNLLGSLTRGGVVTDPQIMIGAIGDDRYDVVPIQIGQFESDNRIDEQLRDVYLEGGGGGDKREGYALAAYFLATRARTDAWAKRGKKGYVFVIGDEMNKEVLSGDSIRRRIGDQVDGDIDVASVYAELNKRWHTYFILPNMTSYYHDPEIEAHWREIVGERFVRLENPAGLVELIAGTVALTEQATNGGNR
ncbi:MAG: hypothetical protein QM662_05175 [Gordonia sp. (in: high G+C Gram-positive bacteria)]